MQTLPLSQSVQVVLSGGAGTVSTGPLGQGEVWDVTSAAVQVSTADNEATCVVQFAGIIADVALWGSTGGGSTAVSGTLRTGQEITATWTGGDDGAIAYLSVFGTRRI